MLKLKPLKNYLKECLTKAVNGKVDPNAEIYGFLGKCLTIYLLHGADERVQQISQKAKEILVQVAHSCDPQIVENGWSLDLSSEDQSNKENMPPESDHNDDNQM